MMQNSGKIIPAIATGIGMGIGIASLNPQAAMEMTGGGAAIASFDIPPAFRWSNRPLLQALNDIEHIQANMAFTSGDRTVDILEEARAGGMYDFDQSN